MVTCWEWADLLALVGDVYCIFVTFPCGILGQVWYLIVSFSDLCRLSYINMTMIAFDRIISNVTGHVLLKIPNLNLLYQPE